MVVSYENAKIYKIIGPNVSDPCYVGSTTKKYLSQRKSKHIECYKLWKKSEDKKYKKIMSFDLFEQHGPENCQIILLEAVNVNSKDELRMKEQEYIDKLDCANKAKAYCSIEEQKLLRQKWLENNKETLAAKKKAYAEANKAHLDIKKKENYEANKERILAKNKAYLEANREADKLYRQRIYVCENCKCEVRLAKKSTHNKTLKHIANTKALEQVQ